MSLAGVPAVLRYFADAEGYDAWYEAHPHAYEAELAALRPLVGHPERGLEVGVGTGRFAAPLDVDHGVDPSRPMLERARRRGVEAIQDVGERLPLTDDSFDLVLIVAALSFAADPRRLLAECRRVLAPRGRLVVGLLDAGSPLGGSLRGAVFEAAELRSATETVELLVEAGFALERARQTIFDPLEEIDQPPAVREGAGEGLFAALQARPRSA